MPNYFHTLAHMAVVAQAPVARVQAILDEIEASPAMVLNLTPYYDAEVLGTVLAIVNSWLDQPAAHRTYGEQTEVQS